MTHRDAGRLLVTGAAAGRGRLEDRATCGDGNPSDTCVS